eukprot:6436434-Karenia_brevis.AAC.1
MPMIPAYTTMRCRYKINPNDGQIYTFSEIAERYKDTLTPEALQDFWDKRCAPIERSNPTSWAKDAKPK